MQQVVVIGDDHTALAAGAHSRIRLSSWSGQSLTVLVRQASRAGPEIFRGGPRIGTFAGGPVARTEPPLGGGESDVRASFYVDGFNLYYGALRGTPWKWLDLSCLGRRLLPGHDLIRIRYFTARVSATADDPKAPQRQQCYLRALRTVPGLSIHLGVFRSRVASMPLVGSGSLVRVVRTEEKGSDVNLASYLLLDAFRRGCEVALVLSNDSDLLEPVRLVQEEFGVPVGVVNPHPAARRSRALLSAAAFFRQLRPATLRDCQFAVRLIDSEGEFTRPSEWA